MSNNTRHPPQGAREAFSRLFGPRGARAARLPTPAVGMGQGHPQELSGTHHGHRSAPCGENGGGMGRIRRGGPTRPAAEMRGFLANRSRVVDGFVIFFVVLARNQVLCTGLPNIWWIAPVDRLLKLFPVENRQMQHLARI